MIRSVIKTVFIGSGILFMVFGSYIFFLVIQMVNAPASSAQMGIIGGAGAPTMFFMLQKLASTPVFYGAVLFLFLFIATGLTLIFAKSDKAR